NCKVEVVVSTEAAIISAIEKNFASKVTYEAILTEIEKDADQNEKSPLDNANLELIDVEKGGDDAPIVKLVNLMLTEAIKMRASDIHIEPYEKRFRIRFRVDGTLYEKLQPNPSVAAAVTSRIKIMSK